MRATASLAALPRQLLGGRQWGCKEVHLQRVHLETDLQNLADFTGCEDNKCEDSVITDGRRLRI